MQKKNRSASVHDHLRGKVGCWGSDWGRRRKRQDAATIGAPCNTCRILPNSICSEGHEELNILAQLATNSLLMPDICLFALVRTLLREHVPIR